MSGPLTKSWRAWSVPLDPEAQSEQRKIDAEVAQSRLAIAREHLEGSRATADRARSILDKFESQKRNLPEVLIMVNFNLLGTALLYRNATSPKT